MAGLRKGLRQRTVLCAHDITLTYNSPGASALAKHQH